MRRKKSIALSVISISVLIITLYGMWGDPWGGWAFGIRYMIPAFAVLSIPLGIAIKEYGKKWFFVIPFIIIFIYSVFINLAGALTTNKIPPSVEVDSERYPTYTFIHNIKLALDGKTSSYIYNTYLENINFRIFFFTLFAIIISLILINYLLLRLESKNNHDQKDH